MLFVIVSLALLKKSKAEEIYGKVKLYFSIKTIEASVKTGASIVIPLIILLFAIESKM